MARTCRILSFDGGGCWALIQARALAALYGGDTPGRTILAEFDFAFANSGGSIVLGGLAVDKTPNEIAQIFLDESLRRRMFVGKSPFSPLTWLNHMIGIGPKYKTAPKLEMLRKQLGRGQLLTLAGTGADGVARQTHIAIVAFDYDRERHFLFRSAPEGPKSNVHCVNCELAEAVHASTTAPVNFFDRPATLKVRRNGGPHVETLRLWDGGVTGLNNPVAAAVCEALSLGRRADDCKVLSIGTANVFLPNTRTNRSARPNYVTKRTARFFARDIKKLSTAVLGDPPDFASFVAHCMLGGRAPAEFDAPPITETAVIRLNPAITPAWTGRWEAPAALGRDDFDRLLNLPIDALAESDVALIDRLAERWMRDEVYNQPIRFNFFNPDSAMVAEVGHLAFSDAKAQWAAL